MTRGLGLLLLTTVGLNLMAATSELMSIYLSLEISSLSLAFLSAWARDDLRSSEAGLKFFVLSALSSALLLFGMAVLYGLTGATTLKQIATVLTGPLTPAGLLAMSLVLAAATYFVANSLRLARFSPLPEEAPRVSLARSDESKFRPRRLLPDAKGTGMAATYEKGTLLTCEHEGCGCRVLIQEQCNCSGADNSNYTCGCGAKLIPVSGS